MTIKAGERMPEGKFKTMGDKGPKDLTTAELFGGKRVVLFSVPGAFHPDLRCQASARLSRAGRRSCGQGRGYHRLHGGQRRVRDECLGQAVRPWATRC
jgi:hypothetical protein